VGLVERLALGDHVTAVEPLQHDAGEHEVRGRRADVDPDAQHADLVLLGERASGRGEEDAPARAGFGHRLGSDWLHARSCAGLTRASISLRQKVMRWIAGASPATTRIA